VGGWVGVGGGEVLRLCGPGEGWGPGKGSVALEAAAAAPDHHLFPSPQHTTPLSPPPDLLWSVPGGVIETAFAYPGLWAGGAQCGE